MGVEVKETKNGQSSSRGADREQIITKALETAQKGSHKEKEAALRDLYQNYKTGGALTSKENITKFKAAEIGLLNSLGRHEEALEKSLDLVKYQDGNLSKLGAAGIRDSIAGLQKAYSKGDVIDRLRSKDVSAIEKVLAQTEQLNQRTKTEVATALYGALGEGLLNADNNVRGILQGSRIGPKLDKLAEGSGSKDALTALRHIATGNEDKVAASLERYTASAGSGASPELVSQLGRQAYSKYPRPEILQSTSSNLIKLGRNDLAAEIDFQLIVSYNGRITAAEQLRAISNVAAVTGKSPSEVISATDKVRGDMASAGEDQFWLQAVGTAFTLLMAAAPVKQSRTQMNQRVAPKVIEMAPAPGTSSQTAVQARYRVVNGPDAVSVPQQRGPQLVSSTPEQPTIVNSTQPGGFPNSPIRPPIAINRSNGAGGSHSRGPIVPPTLPGSQMNRPSQGALPIERVDTALTWRKVEKAMDYNQSGQSHLSGAAEERGWARSLGGQLGPKWGPLDKMKIDVVVPANVGKQAGIAGIPMSQAKSHAAWGFEKLAQDLAQRDPALSRTMAERASALRKGNVSNEQFADMLGIDRSLVSDGYIYGLQVKNSPHNAHAALMGGAKHVVVNAPKPTTPLNAVLSHLRQCFTGGEVANGFAI